MSILQSDFCETGYFLCPEWASLAKSKFRTVLHLFIFACSFRGQNLPRASFAAAAKNEFVSSGTCWGFRFPKPSILCCNSQRFPPKGGHSFDR